MASDFLFPGDVWQERGGEGILPSQEIRHFIQTGKISATPAIEESQIQPGSIDLRLSHEAYQVRASFLPTETTTLLNKAKANGMLEKEFDISRPTRLEPRVIYIVPLIEELALPSDVYGIANPKSTTGRLDIFTRLITEHGDEFERVRRGYRGRLYIEILSQSFPVVIQGGMTLNQLRLARGKVDPVGFDRLRNLDQEELLVHPDEDTQQTNIDRGVRITVNLKGNGSDIVGYQAKKFSPPVELSRINYYDIAEFWTPIRKSSQCSFILEPGAFYILASKQRVRVSPEYAAELLPYDLATQEFRVHYAGFFDPGFGYGSQGEIPGTRAVLEVRASQMPILLEDNQFVGRLNYFKMAATPDKVYGGSIGSSYQRQGLTLSKQFKRDEQYLSGYAVGSTGASQEGPGIISRQIALASRAEEIGADDEDDSSLVSHPLSDGSFGQLISAKDI